MFSNMWEHDFFQTLLLPIAHLSTTACRLVASRRTSWFKDYFFPCSLHGCKREGEERLKKMTILLKNLDDKLLIIINLLSVLTNKKGVPLRNSPWDMMHMHHVSLDFKKKNKKKNPKRKKKCFMWAKSWRCLKEKVIGAFLFLFFIFSIICLKLNSIPF